MLENVEKYPWHMHIDYITKNQNIKDKIKLCDHCDGTGNVLYSMYKKCQACNGTGKFNKDWNCSKE